MKDLSEVCPVSRGMMSFSLNPYPLYYREAFAFSDFFYPHPIRPSLRSAYLIAKERYGLTLFRLIDK
jgi:hypothetical protein